MTEHDDDSVGYGRPPKHTRFRKGESGNPQGRPRRDVDAASEDALDMMVPVTIRGRRRRMAAILAIRRLAVQKALAGDAEARRDVFRYDLQRERMRSLAKTDQQRKNPFTLIIGVPGESRIIREAIGLGLIEKVEDKRYRIADWARVAARTVRAPRLPPPSGSTI